MVKVNSCVFISGAGTNLSALIKNSRNYNFPINIKLVVSNKKNAAGLKIAKKFSIPLKIIDTNSSLFEINILNEIRKRKINLICLAGYMRILSKNFIKNFKGKILNIHPSLLPKYKGTKTFEKILKNQEKITGCTVHYVNDKLDSGKIILMKKVNISKKDNIKSLKKKTQSVEYKAYSEAIIRIFRKF
ncbi:MAG: phosphoribosylglycinamide formyltransferase [Pelagibacteraceae bacterium]